MGHPKSGIRSDDVLVMFVDLQVGIVELTQTVSLGHLKTGVFALAKLAKLFDMPAIVSGIAGEDGSPAQMVPQLTQGLGDVSIRHRTTCDSFLNAEIQSSIKASGRKTLLISGVATELAVQLPALSACDLGYRVYAVVDACGGMSERTEQAAFRRMSNAGATTLSVMTLAGEIAGDFSDPKGQQAIRILYEMAKPGNV